MIKINPLDRLIMRNQQQKKNISSVNSAEQFIRTQEMRFYLLTPLVSQSQVAQASLPVLLPPPPYFQFW